ncbi:hypothetical protein BDFB_003365, partial [Asbolus verrucosus]
MFSKRNLVDVKKSTSKIQDPKKDLATRIKHLKIILDNVDIAEAKGLFEANFSHVYNILYDSFIQAEGNLRQRVHKAHKEELDCTLWILEQVLCLLPELIHKRWQLHSLGRILSKLLHPGNSIKLRRQAIRFFLMWYQALNDNAPDYVHNMFETLVPGFNNPTSLPTQISGSVFHDTSAQHPVTPSELLPVLPPSGGEKGPEHPSKFFLEALLEHMVHTVIKLEWQDKAAHHHRCFHFLLEKFKVYYLMKICPNFSHESSLYTPNLGMNNLSNIFRKAWRYLDFRFACFEETRSREVSLIMWVASYLHLTKKNADGGPASLTHSTNNAPVAPHEEETQHESAHPSLDSTISIHTNKTASDEDLAAQIVREVLCSSRDNVNFIHELYRQAFLINFSHVIVIRKIIAVYKDLIQLNVPEIPCYMLEPLEDASRFVEDAFPEGARPARLRNDSYLGAIHKENLLVRAGMQHRFQGAIIVGVVANNFPSFGGMPPQEKNGYTRGETGSSNFPDSYSYVDQSEFERGNIAGIMGQVFASSYVFNELGRIDQRMGHLTDLPLDRLTEQKSKRGRRLTNRPENNAQCNMNEHGHIAACRQDSSLPDGNVLRKKNKHGLTRSYSETSLNVKRRSSQRQKNTKHRRSLSLDNLPQLDTESTDRTRSPSPAPSSGLESNSIKDSPIQLDVLSTENSSTESSGEHRGVVCGGSIRGWLPDVAVILWRRMLGALGDINTITDPKLHAQVFEYLVKLTETLIKIKHNQGVSADNQSTPVAPELIPPVTLILPWCFGALMLPEGFESGKLNALRLLCTVTLDCDCKHRNYLPQFYRFLHMALIGNSKPFLNTTLKFLGPRFLSLQLPGFSLLLLDLIHACNTVLNSIENLEGAPRTEAISIIANLLSLPDDLNCISVLQPEENIHVISCPDIKEHVVSILLRAGRREPKGKARCIALSALGMFVYKELTNQTFHPKVADAINVLLLALKLASNILFLLCDHASLLWTQYPRLGNAVIRTLCGALFLHEPLGSTAGESDKALGTALLLCLGEWCMRLEPKRLLEVSEYGEERGSCLLLQVFT